MRELSKRINLVHELRELTTRKEIADNSAQSLRVNQLLRRDRVNTLVIKCHTLFNETLCASQTDTTLVRKKLSHCAHTTTTQVVNIVEHTVTTLEACEILRRFDDVFSANHAEVQIGVHRKLLIELVTTHATQVITTWILEETLEQCLGICSCGGLTRAKALVNILERFFFVLSRVLLKATNDGTIVDSGVNRRDLL